MPTFNDRGFPLYSDSEAMPAWDVAYNAQSNLLSTALTESEDAGKEDDSVELIADLPVTGNWVGRRIWVVEDESLRVCRELPASWLIAFRTLLVGLIDWEAGWSAEPGHSVSRDASQVFITFNGEKTSSVVSGDIAGHLPVGFRPGATIYTAGSYHGTGDPGPAIVTITVGGEVRVFFGGTTTQKKLAFTVAFPI